MPLPRPWKTPSRTSAGVIRIRSYVLDASRIKDLRTNIERSDCDKVLDGDIDEYLIASLKQGL